MSETGAGLIRRVALKKRPLSFPSRLTLPLQPRRLRIAPAANGCKRMLACPFEGQLPVRKSSQCLDHHLALARLHPRPERFHVDAWKDRDAALTHDGSGVVLGLDEVHGRTGFSLPRREYGLEDSVSEHALAAELG